MYLQLYESEIHDSYNCSAITFLILLKKSLRSISLKTENTLQQWIQTVKILFFILKEDDTIWITISS